MGKKEKGVRPAKRKSEDVATPAKKAKASPARAIADNVYGSSIKALPVFSIVSNLAKNTYPLKDRYVCC